MTISHPNYTLLAPCSQLARPNSTAISHFPPNHPRRRSPHPLPPKPSAAKSFGNAPSKAQPPQPPPHRYPQKKDPLPGASQFFVLNDLLILFLFHLVDQGFKSIVEGLFERLGRTFYEEVMLGDMNSYLRNLVFDGVNYIVQLQEHINFDNSVMERV
jgi:hypothetical protein